MNKKVIIAGILILSASMTSCQKVTDSHNIDVTDADNSGISISFDSEGNYTGFENIPEDYTVEQALEDGCYIIENFNNISGESFLESFYEKTSNEEDASLRVVYSFIEEDDEILYYGDLFYSDGFYQYFDSTSEDLKEEKYKYIVELSGKLLNSDYESRVTVITDDKDITYDDVFLWIFSSSTGEIDGVSPFKVVFLY